MKKMNLAVLLTALAGITLGQGLSGRRAPSFTLPDAKMKSYDILDYRGRWLVLDYMKTDRRASKPLTKDLEKLKSRRGTKVRILSILLPPNNTATAAIYVKET